MPQHPGKKKKMPTSEALKKFQDKAVEDLKKFQDEPGSQGQPFLNILEMLQNRFGKKAFEQAEKKKKGK